MIKMSKLAAGLTIAALLAVAVAGEATAAPAPSGTVAVKAAVPSATTAVRYRAHRAEPYSSYYGSYSYPGWGYWGYPNYSYWPYSSYSYWGYPGYGYAFGW